MKTLTGLNKFQISALLAQGSLKECPAFVVSKGAARMHFGAGIHIQIVVADTPGANMENCNFVVEFGRPDCFWKAYFIKEESAKAFLKENPKSLIVGGTFERIRVTKNYLNRI